MDNACPTDEALQSLVIGETVDEATASHAATCPDCQSRFSLIKNQITLLQEVAPFLEAGRETAPTHPATIGKYVIIGPIAEGGQAQVYRALHPKLGKDLAIKLSRRPMQSGPHDMLLTEAKLLADLDHPNLVRVLDVDVHEDRPYVVMEYIRGETLEQRTGNARPSPREAATLVSQVSRAVAMAHRRGIVHQDIKPGNILIDDLGRPHLGDFGLARLRDAWTDPGQEQPSGGTPGFMAPEQARRDLQKVGPRTDIFALGGVLFFLLTGETPIPGTEAMAVLQRTARGEIDLTPLQRPDVPRSLAAVCRRALSEDPADRHASAEELANELNRYLQRPRHLKIAATVAAALFLSALLGWTWFNRDEPPQFPDERQFLIHLEDGTPIGAALPLGLEHRFHIECLIPKGYRAGAFLLDTDGQVLPMAKLVIHSGDKFDRLLCPSDKQSMRMIGKKGTNLLLVCADPRADTIESDRIRPLLEELKGWSSASDAVRLPDRVIVWFDRNTVEVIVPRGVEEASPTTIGAVRAQLEHLRMKLREQCQFCIGVAFSQKDAFSQPGK